MQTPSHLLVDPGAKVKLGTDHLAAFKPGQVFDFYPENASYAQSSHPMTANNRLYLGAPIVSMDFHGSGAHLLATTLHENSPNQPTPVVQNTKPTAVARSSSQRAPSSARFTSCLHLFNSLKGIHNKTVYFDNQLIHRAIFTHHYSTVLTAGHNVKTTATLAETNRRGPPAAPPDVNSQNPSYLRTLLRNCPGGESSLPVSLAYTSLVDNTQLQGFYGHVADIVSMQMNPMHDSFVTSSVDRTVRLWDLRSDISQGVLYLNGSLLNNAGQVVQDQLPPGLSTVGGALAGDARNTASAVTTAAPAAAGSLASVGTNTNGGNANRAGGDYDDAVTAIDPQGIVLALAVNNSIQLFDFRTLESGEPFAVFYLTNIPSCTFHHISFSQDGTTILVSCSSRVHTPLSRHGAAYFHTLQRSQVQLDPNNALGSSVPLNLSSTSYRTSLAADISQNQSADSLGPAAVDSSANGPNGASAPNVGGNSNNTTSTTTGTGVLSESFVNFDHVLLLDAFNGQLLQRVSLPRSSSPLTTEQLQQVGADAGLKSFAPNATQLSTLQNAAGLSNNSRNANSALSPVSSLSSFGNLANLSPHESFLRVSQQLHRSFAPIWYHPMLPLYSYQYAPDQLQKMCAITAKNSILAPPSFSLTPSRFFSLPCAMTADSKYLSVGTTIGTIPTHDVRSGRQVVTFSHQQQAEIQHVKWNPTHTQLVTANPYEIVFWVPSAK